MLSIVDPAADTIRESVATIVTFGNIEERRPSTDEEWEALQHKAVRLVEATNLLLMPGRDVARPGFSSENPGIELEPEEVQALIDEDLATWHRLLGDYGVPTGTHTIQAWHEEYGVLTQTVTVEAGAVVVADFTYPPAAP